MSWTQGIQIREDCSETQVKNLDKIGEIKLGEGYKFLAFVWDDTQPGIMYLDYQNEAGEFRSLKYTDNPPLSGKKPTEL
jgi:hypothetical protein